MSADDRLVGAGGELDASIAAVLVEAFVKVPNVGVAILSAEGQILYENAEVRRLYLEAPEGDFVGRRLTELFPKDWMDERLKILHRVATTGQGAALREVWRGRQLLVTFRQIPAEPGETPEVLLISRPVEGPDAPKLQDGLHVEESVFVELGELSVLTPRELIVLALLGQGLTLKEIAGKLHRSFKTVDNHRSSIGRKLNQTDRLVLARLATQAGLRVDDAKLARVSFRPPKL